MNELAGGLYRGRVEMLLKEGGSSYLSQNAALNPKSLQYLPYLK